MALCLSWLLSRETAIGEIGDTTKRVRQRLLSVVLEHQWWRRVPGRGPDVVVLLLQLPRRRVWLTTGSEAFSAIASCRMAACLAQRRARGRLTTCWAITCTMFENARWASAPPWSVSAFLEKA